MSALMADVVIVGGGVIGSSAAWHLRQDGFRGRIIVIERDPSYARSSSFLAMGGIRQQFCTPVTVQMMRYSVALWKRFDSALGTAEARPHAWFRQRGYLFLANAGAAPALMRRYEDERRAGAAVQLLSVDEIRHLVPHLRLDDILFGVLGPEDGYANPREVLAGFRRGAAAAGAEYVADDVVGISTAGGRVTGVQLASGTTIATDKVVNAAGAWSGGVAQLAGLDVPVSALRQMLFRCTLPHAWPYRFPMIVDPDGVHWRHDDPVQPGDADGIILALTNWGETPGENFATDASRWEREFYPAMVQRMPALAGVSNVVGWAGMYEMTPDHNPVIGEHPALAGLFFASGFSGHGLMMSPATGRIAAEWAMGAAPTFDVGLFAPDRFARGALVQDAATI